MTTHELALKYTQPVYETLEEVQTTPFNHNYEPRPTDVILNTYPKAGTALMQQMCYQIVVQHGGASKEDPTGMEYDDIAIAVPWIDKPDMPESKTFPRLFKSHLSVTDFKPQASKHLVIVRSPKQFAASFLNFVFFIKNHELDADSVPEDILRECVHVLTDSFVLSTKFNDHTEEYKGLGTWHQRFKSATIPKTKNVMILFYEDVVKNLEPTIKRVAKFMDCEISEEGVQTVLKRCDRKYMANDSKFDGHFERDLFKMKGNPIHTFPENYEGFKKFPITDKQFETIDDMNFKAFGVKSYDEIRKIINAQQRELHGY